MLSMNHTIFRTACLGAASYLALSITTPLALNTASAQTVLPPVNVDAPKPQTVRRVQPARRAARSQSATRRAAVSAQRQTVRSRRPRRRRRTRQRPGGRLSRQPERDRHQDRHADSHHAAVDFRRHQGSDRSPGRPEPRRGVALHAGRHAGYLRRHHLLRCDQAPRLRGAALSRWPSAAAGSRNAVRLSAHRDLRP